jgi:hypothetical protein
MEPIQEIRIITLITSNYYSQGIKYYFMYSNKNGNNDCVYFNASTVEIALNNSLHVAS